MSSPTKITNFTGIPERTSFETWLNIAAHYDDHKYHVERDELNNLNSHEKKAVLSLMESHKVYHDPIAKNDKDYLAKLFQAGIDPNITDKNGCSLLGECEDIEMYKWLINHGVKFIHPEMTHLEFVLEQIESESWKKEDNDRDIKKEDGWLKILTQLIKDAKIEDFAALRLEYIQHLIEYRTPEIEGILLKNLQNFQKLYPEKAFEIALDFLTEDYNLSLYIKGFFYLVENGYLDHKLIEKLLKNPTLFNQYGKDLVEKSEDEVKYFYRVLFTKWKKPPLLEEIINQTSITYRYTDSIFCYVLLQSENLSEAGDILILIPSIKLVLPQISSELKQRCIRHIEDLQKRERKTIWAVLDRDLDDLELEIVQLLLSFGLDPNWKDLNFGRNILFSRYVHFLSHDLRINIERDKNGNNALDHHLTLSNYPKMIGNLDALVKKGIRMSDNLPHIEICRALFPDHHWFQTLLMVCMIKPARTSVRSHLRFISKDESDLFVTQVFQTTIRDARLQKVKNILTPSNTDGIGRWSDRFHANDFTLLTEKQDMSSLSTIESLTYLTTSLSQEFPGKFPSELFRVIPGSPIACLSFHAFVFHQTDPFKKPIRQSWLFGAFESHDVIAFCNFVFQKSRDHGALF